MGVGVGRPCKPTAAGGGEPAAQKFLPRQPGRCRSAEPPGGTSLGPQTAASASLRKAGRRLPARPPARLPPQRCPPQPAPSPHLPPGLGVGRSEQVRGFQSRPTFQKPRPPADSAQAPLPAPEPSRTPRPARRPPAGKRSAHSPAPAQGWATHPRRPRDGVSLGIAALPALPSRGARWAARWRPAAAGSSGLRDLGSLPRPAPPAGAPPPRPSPPPLPRLAPPRVPGRTGAGDPAARAPPLLAAAAPLAPPFPATYTRFTTAWTARSRPPALSPEACERLNGNTDT